MCLCTCSLSFFPHLKKLIWKSFKASTARRFTDYAWIPWSVFSHRGSRKLMKMHSHTHELRHTWNCFLSVCPIAFLCVCASVVTVKLTPTVWGKYQNLKKALLLHTAAKSCRFRGSGDSCKWNSFNTVAVQETCQDSMRKGELRGTPLGWIFKCSVLLLFCFFYKHYFYKFLCLRGWL